jgi:hypothetical protein
MTGDDYRLDLLRERHEDEREENNAEFNRNERASLAEVPPALPFDFIGHDFARERDEARDEAERLGRPVNRSERAIADGATEADLREDS